MHHLGENGLLQLSHRHHHRSLRLQHRAHEMLEYTEPDLHRTLLYTDLVYLSRQRSIALFSSAGLETCLLKVEPDHACGVPASRIERAATIFFRSSHLPLFRVVLGVPVVLEGK